MAAAATGEPRSSTWSSRERLALVALFAIGIALRAALVQTIGFLDDMDQFARWISHISNAGLGQLYTDNPGGRVTFGPVMGYVWSILAAIEPGFATATDASDPTINALMKVPASLADLGMAALIVVALRDRPSWALVGAAAVLLHPAVIDVSAWWGQYESIYVLPALGAVIAASRGRNGLAAALLTVSLATKPQAIPFILPFVAWCYAAGGIREVVRCGVVGAVTLAVLWLPFIPAGGPQQYLANLAYYQSEVFNALSLRAWNPWWVLQEAAAGGQFIPDDVPIVGPITFRHIGYAITGLLSLAIMATVIRDPRPRTYILATTASVLVFFMVMTQMHERYSYAALIFPILLLVEPRLRAWWLALSVVVTINLLSAIPPTERIHELLPQTGPLTVIGSIVLTGLAAWLFVECWRSARAAPQPPVAAPS
jgi:Gpi18-like mannosyltransferase